MHCYQDEETRRPAWCSSAFIDIVESSGFPRDGSAELACKYHTRQLWLQRSTEQFAFRGWGFCLFVWLFSSYKGRALCKVPWHLQYLDRMRHLRMSSHRQHSYYEGPWQLGSAKVQTIGPSTPAFWGSASTMCKPNQGGVVAENQLCRNKCLFVRWINSLNWFTMVTYMWQGERSSSSGLDWLKLLHNQEGRTGDQVLYPVLSQDRETQSELQSD